VHWAVSPLLPEWPMGFNGKEAGQSRATNALHESTASADAKGQLPAFYCRAKVLDRESATAAARRAGIGRGGVDFHWHVWGT